jgi:hypothetical protein
MRREGAMVASKERPTTVDQPSERPWWMRPVVAVTAIVVVAVAVVAAVLLLGDGDEEDVDPIESVQEFAENLRQGNMAAAAAFLAPEYAVDGDTELFDLGFWEWISILEKPEFTDCQVLNETANGSDIRCTYLIGEDTWMSQVLGVQATTTFTASVDTEGVMRPSFASAPPGEIQAEVDFREWIRATHPADEDRMFGGDAAEVYRFSKESAELHMQYLDEYLAYKATNE